MAKNNLRNKFITGLLASSMVVGGVLMEYSFYKDYKSNQFTKQDEVLREDLDSLKTRISYLAYEAPLKEDVLSDLEKTTLLYKTCKLADNYSSLQKKISYELNPDRSKGWVGFAFLSLGSLFLYSLTIKETNILPDPEQEQQEEQ